jgi:hypothetical protein
MSPLFPDIVQCMGIQVLEIKKVNINYSLPHIREYIQTN